MKYLHQHEPGPDETDPGIEKHPNWLVSRMRGQLPANTRLWPAVERGVMESTSPSEGRAERGCVNP